MKRIIAISMMMLLLLGGCINTRTGNGGPREAEDPGTDLPGTEDPGTDNPGTDYPGVEDPGTEEPDADQPRALPGGKGGEWPDLRDGVVYLHSEDSREIGLRWRGAWASSGHMETIYFQGPTGKLLGRRRVEFSEVKGSEIFRTTGQAGDYRLEVPGMSYRYYSVSVPAGVRSVFEPAKVHHSMNVPSRATFYFHVPAGRSFTVNGKYHGGVGGLVAIDPGGREKALTLVKRTTEGEYPLFDKLEFPSQAKAGVWGLKFKGKGKVSFWVDGIPNLFARDPGDCFVPEFQKGSAAVHVSAEVMGSRPLLGATMPFANLPRQGYEVLQSMGVQAANFYAFQEALAKGSRYDFRDREWLNTYERQLMIDEYLVIFLADRSVYKGKAPPLDQLQPFTDFMRMYLAEHRGQGGRKVPYVAFHDEPNSRFKSVEDYTRYYMTLAGALRSDRNSAVSGVKIGAPESSGLINGPTKKDANRRRGADWVAALLKEDWDAVDAISWHEWVVRDLIATEWYGESVQAAWDLQARYAPRGAAPKDLLITQTNIGSGRSICAYEQDTFYAALWWGSVVAHASGPGKLKMLNWLSAFDEKGRVGGKIEGGGGKAYNKGLVAHDRSGARMKPVGKCMKFLNEHLLPDVLATTSDAVEVAALATTNGAGRTSVLLVNKFGRRQDVSLDLELPGGRGSGAVRWTLMKLDSGSQVSTAGSGDGSLSGGTFKHELTLDGEAIYFLILETKG